MPTKAQLHDRSWTAAAMAREARHNSLVADQETLHAVKRALGRPDRDGHPADVVVSAAVQRAGRSARVAAKLAADLQRNYDDLVEAQRAAKARR